MCIYIIHGDDTVSSRNYYISQRQRVKEPIILYGENIDINQLTQVFQSTGLFEAAEKNVFIENFFQKKENKELLNYLHTQSEKSNIFIWESKELSKMQISILKNANVKHFPLPKTLFAFLNELKPNNSRKTITLFRKTLEQIEVELIFFMIVRHFRLLLAVRNSNTENQIDEVKKMAPWQKTRLIQQAKMFSEVELKKTFHSITDIEISQKTGKSILSLPQAIDFLLLSI